MCRNCPEPSGASSNYRLRTKPTMPLCYPLLAGIETQLAWTPPTLTDLNVQKLSRAFRRLLELQAQDEADNATLLPTARRYRDPARLDPPYTHRPECAETVPSLPAPPRITGSGRSRQCHSVTHCS